MKVFVTGGTGYVGSHIVARLLAESHEVTVLTRRVALPSGIAGASALSVTGGLVACRDLKHIFSGFDVVVANAILWTGDSGKSDERAASAVFRAAAEARVKHLIYTSSTAVHRPFLQVMDEETVLQPTDSYAVAKATNEAMLLSVSLRHGLPFTIVRPGPVVGRPVEGTALKTLASIAEIERTVRSGGVVEVVGGEGRQFVCVRDLADLYAQIVERGGSGETYLAVAPEVVSWESIARGIVKRLGIGSVSVGGGAAPPVFRVDRLRREFGLTMRFEPGLTEHLDLLCAAESAGALDAEENLV